MVIEIKKIDSPFYYRISIIGSPLEPLTYISDKKIAPGTFVKVPLRKKTHQGIVVSECESADFKCKEVIEITPFYLPLNYQKIAKFISKYYLCSYAQALSLFVPFNKPSTIHHQPSTIHHPPSTIHHQPSTIHHQLDYSPFYVGAQEKEKKEKTNEDPQDISAVNFGLALHYMLEIIKDFKKEEIEEAYWGMRNRFGMLLEDDKLEDIKNRVERLVNDKKFIKLIYGARIYKEQPLSYRGEIKQLDLLAEFDDRVVVIDYKSSKYILDEHKMQVKRYKIALEDIYDKETHAYLCYLRSDIIQMVKL